MTRRSLVIGASVLAITSGCTVPPSTAEQYAGTPTVVGDSVLVFPSGARYAPGLRGLQYHALLPTTTGVPFLVVSGFEAPPGNEAERAVFVLRPDQPRPAQQPVRSVFAFPHAPAQPAEPSADSAAAQAGATEARLFVGECTYGGHGSVVQFTTTHEGLQPRHAVIAREVHADSLVDVIDQDALPSLQDVLAAVELGRCQEVPRRER